MQMDRVLTVAAGHLVHDTFTAFLSPLLPLIVQKLSISLATAGALPLVFRLPSLLNPFIGLWADRIDLRMLVVIAPALSATAMSLIGVAPNLGTLALFVFLAGCSSAVLHVPAPVIITRVSGRRVGTGMSFWMVGGELARTVGPLLAVAVVTWRTLEGYYPIMVLGWATSVVLYFRLRDVKVQPRSKGTPAPLGDAWRVLRPLMLPLLAVLLLRSFMQAALVTFLPILMTSSGKTLWTGGLALATVEAAGAAGALAAGIVSDRFGRRRVLGAALLLAPASLLAFLSLDDGGALSYLLLGLTGFLLLSTTPVIMAMVQEVGREYPATANGVYMGISFLLTAGAAPVVGWVGDAVGLGTAFFWSAILAFVAAPLTLLLPASRRGGSPTGDIVLADD